MENRSDDRCTKTPGRTKTAAGLTVYLLEELGDARMRCAQLKLLVAEAQKLVEHSTHRDHIFEVGAHLLHSIPDNLFRLEKALDAAAMSASRLDYEEIKQNLKPEKAEELEQVLSDARLRYLTRRSQQLSSPKVALAEIERLASVTEQTGKVHVTELLVLAAALETGVKTAGETPSAAQRLRDIVTAAAQEKSRIALAHALRTFLADAMEPTAAHAMQALLQSASSREDVMDGFKDANPELTEEQLKEIADQWERNKDVVKDKSATIEPTSAEMIAKFEEGKSADPTENMSPEDAKRWHEMNDKYKDVVKDQHKEAGRGYAKDPHWITARYPGTADDGTPFKKGDRVLYFPLTKTFMVGPKAEAAMRKFESEVADEAFYNYHSASDMTAEQELVARFEEGKPADPTENMSDEDAAEWEAMNDKYKDVVKDKHARVAKLLDEVTTLHKTAFVPDALTGERVAMFVDSLRDRLLIAQRSLKAGDWRHFKMALRHLVLDMTAIFGALGMADAVTKLELIHRELVATPLGTPSGAAPQPARIAKEMSKEASASWQSYSPFLIEAKDRETVMKGFKEANPKLTDEQLEEIADHWEKHKDVVKDKHKSASAETPASPKMDPLTGAWSAASSSGDDLV